MAAPMQNDKMGQIVQMLQQLLALAQQDQQEDMTEQAPQGAPDQAAGPVDPQKAALARLMQAGFPGR